MEIKSITYERVLNLGNYENKKLQLFAEVIEGDDVEESISRVMETVERKIREEQEIGLVARIRTLETKASNLRQEISYLEEKLGELKNQQDNLTGIEPDSDASLGGF